jgi:hypothetical protein
MVWNQRVHTSPVTSLAVCGAGEPLLAGTDDGCLCVLQQPNVNGRTEKREGDVVGTFNNLSIGREDSGNVAKGNRRVSTSLEVFETQQIRNFKH